jgi:hypothetical protein
MPLGGLMPGGNIAMAAESLPIRRVPRQSLAALGAYFEPLADVLAAALAARFVSSPRAHRFALLNTA